MPIIKTDITALLTPSRIRRSASDRLPSPKVVSIVDSRVSIETQAEARAIACEAEKTGLSVCRFLITFAIATVFEQQKFTYVLIFSINKNTLTVFFTF